MPQCARNVIASVRPDNLSHSPLPTNVAASKHWVRCYIQIWALLAYIRSFKGRTRPPYLRDVHVVACSQSLRDKEILVTTQRALSDGLSLLGRFRWTDRPSTHAQIRASWLALGAVTRFSQNCEFSSSCSEYMYACHMSMHDPVDASVHVHEKHLRMYSSHTWRVPCFISTTCPLTTFCLILPETRVTISEQATMAAQAGAARQSRIMPWSRVLSCIIVTSWCAPHSKQDRRRAPP